MTDNTAFPVCVDQSNIKNFDWKNRNTYREEKLWKDWEVNHEYTKSLQ